MISKIGTVLLLSILGVFVVCSPFANAQNAVFQTPTEPLDKDAVEKEQILSDIGLCAGKKIHTERLHCYDKFAIDQGLIDNDEFEKIVREIGKFGLWTFRVQELTTNNEKSASLTLESNQVIEDTNGLSFVPTLSVRCVSGKSEVILDWKKLLTNNRRSVRTKSFPLFIEYQFDNNKSTGSDWEMSFDRRALFAPDPVGFVKQAVKGETLIVNLTPAEGGLTTVSFTLKGLKEGTDQLSKVCYKGVERDVTPKVVTPEVKNLIYSK